MGVTVRVSDTGKCHDMETGRDIKRMIVKCKEEVLERQTENSPFGNETWDRGAERSLPFVLHTL